MENRYIHIHLNVNGVRLRCHDWGGSGDPILLAHGTGMHASLLGPIALSLRSIGRVYSYDRRGHGDSSHDPDALYDWEVETEDLAAVIAQLGLRSVRALGHSAGATLIGSLAAREPQLFARAMLVEPVLIEAGRSLGSQSPGSNDMLERTRRRRRVFDSAAAMYANFENKPPFDTWRRDLLREYCANGAAANANGQWELKCPPEIEARFYATATAFDGLDRLLKCQVPMMVLFGTRGEESTGARFADRLRAELKHVRISSFEDAGHFLPLEKPETVARLALEFFGEP